MRGLGGARRSRIRASSAISTGSPRRVARRMAPARPPRRGPRPRAPRARRFTAAAGSAALVIGVGASSCSSIWAVSSIGGGGGGASADKPQAGGAPARRPRRAARATASSPTTARRSTTSWARSGSARPTEARPQAARPGQPLRAPRPAGDAGLRADRDARAGRARRRRPVPAAADARGDPSATSTAVRRIKGILILDIQPGHVGLRGGGASARAVAVAARRRPRARPGVERAGGRRARQADRLDRRRDGQPGLLLPGAPACG